MMRYPIDFFALQLRFAEQLVERFDLPLGEVVGAYTTLPKVFAEVQEWLDYLDLIDGTSDLVATTYQFYLEHHHESPDIMPTERRYHGWPLFGCFSYKLREHGLIRPHFISNDLPDMRPLGAERAAVRRDELRRMFAYICEHEPTATTVRGNSWLYNLEAYRRLYPPAYTAELPESNEDEFQFLARWAQCYNRNWHIQPTIANELMRRLAQLEDLNRLRFCFPYQILMPSCSIEHFYQFYKIV